MVKITDVELPVVFKDQLLFKAGTWNPNTNKHFKFSNEMVMKSVGNTKWTPMNKRLYFKHDNANDLSHWKGKVENLKTSVAKDGVAEVRGDVELWDAQEALQTLYGAKPHAISAEFDYNDAGMMFFTGFALESDPGVKDNNIFLSDIAKNELSGYYHAKFSAELTNPTYTDERRLNETNENAMTQKTEETKTSTDTVSPVTQGTQTANPNLAKEIEQRMAAMEAQFAQAQAKQAEVKTEPKAEPKPEVKTEGTIAPQQLNVAVNEPAINEKVIESIANKLADVIKSNTPAPVTVHEFASGSVDLETQTVNRIADELAKL